MNPTAYMRDVLDISEAASAADDIIRDYSDDLGTYDIPSVDRCRAIVAGYVVDAERAAIASEPDMWDGTTETEAHDVRAAVIRAIADAVRGELCRRADAAYDARMSCARPTNDCGCRTCSG